MAADNRLIAAHLTAALLGKIPSLNVGEKPEDVAAKLYFDVLKSLETEDQKHKAAGPPLGVGKRESKGAQFRAPK
jgi:hypothetical protein